MSARNSINRLYYYSLGMPNKRSKRKKIKKFYCPYCNLRLWRIGNSKYYKYYQNAAQIKQNTGLSAKKSAFLANQYTTYLDKNRWIEAFCCEKHGMMWLLISASEEGNCEYRIAREKDWLQTDKTPDPNNPNPSVSEFSQRMSRKPR